MRRVLVLGAGKIGGAIVDLLGATGDWDVTVADHKREFLALVDEDRAARRLIDVSDAAAPGELARGQDYLVSALPFFLNPQVARAARDAGAHYFDLTEDVATTRAVRAIADGAGTAFMPQCGLAPASSASRPSTSRRDSTGCARCACGSARSPSSRSTRSSTT
jgi:saccharopine dehydrogenase-like NADP-dependent oxidoreductase